MSLHDSASCCDTPAPTAHASYEPVGVEATFAGVKTYVTGPRDAKKAIFMIYDIFGFQNPTFQGADILATPGYLVVLPDLFLGNAAQLIWKSRDSDEDKEKFAEWRSTVMADREGHLTRIDAVLAALKKEFSGVEKWAAVGYCWGGKICSITSAKDTPWSVGIQTSPGGVSAEDAEKVTIPMMMLASQGEAADAVEAYEKALKVPNVVERFPDRIHGWMSARADLNDAEAKKGFEVGYQKALDFLAKHL